MRKGFPAVTGQQLVEAVPPSCKCLSCEVQFSNIPSSHMNPQLMLKLAKKVDET